MSETDARAPRTAPAPARPEHRGPFLTRDIGPFPMWVWLAVVGGLLAWRYLAGKGIIGAGSTAASSTAASSGTSADLSQQVPQFVNQTYTTVSPPMAPGSTPPGVQPPPPIPQSFPPVPGKPPRVAEFPPPANLKAAGETKNGVTLTWQTRPSGAVYPDSYTVEVFNAKGKAVSTTTVATPDATKGIGTTTLTGLPANQQLHAVVWPNGGARAPKNMRVDFHTAR